MIKIFHRTRLRSVRLIWAAEELGVPYELLPAILHDQRYGYTLTNSPALPITALVDGDVMLTESVAGIQYLAVKHADGRLTRQPADANYAYYLQYLSFGEASASAYLTPVVATMFFAPADDKENWTIKRCKDSYAARLREVEGRLDEAPYLAGEDFTLADISVGYALFVGRNMLLHDAFGPRTVDYFERISARPAAQKAFAAA
jgi:glutathione S-transferase